MMAALCMSAIAGARSVSLLASIPSTARLSVARVRVQQAQHVEREESSLQGVQRAAC